MDMEPIKITNNYTTFLRYFIKTGMQWAVHQFWWGFEETCDSFRKEVLHDVLIGLYFFLPVKLLALMKMYLNEAHSNIWIGRELW